MDKCILTNKKAQGWGLDLSAAIVIFISGVLILYVYAINYTNQSQEILNEMKYEGSLASELILSEDSFGILSDGKVNQTKLEDFNSNYNLRKGIFGIKNDFYFTMEGLTLNGNPADYVGLINSTAVEQLIQTTRVTIYKNKPVKFEIYVWEE
jgi:hypothetical protein